MQDLGQSVIIGESISEIASENRSEYISHVLCEKGECSFVFNDTEFTLVAGESMIITLPKLFLPVQKSRDFKATVIFVHTDFIHALETMSNYGIQGSFRLFRNPVLKLNDEERERCKRDFENVKWRLSNRNHEFYTESVGCALQQLFLDFFDFQLSKLDEKERVAPQSSELVARYLAMLESGEYRDHRDLTYYADKLCVTSKHLSETCKKVSGFPARYWINRFIAIEITELLKNKSLSISEIAYKLNFSSPLHFNNFVKSVFGVPPQQLRG